MNKTELMDYVAFGVDDAMAIRPTHEIPTNLSKVRFVGWQCGFEPMVVAVWSYLPDSLVDESEAEELAAEALLDRGWFANSEPQPADFVL